MIKIAGLDVELPDVVKNTGTDIDPSVLINYGLGLAGAVAVGFIIFGAIKYATAQGSPDKIRSATQTIIYAVIGVIIISLALVLTNFVFKTVEGAG